MTESDQDDLEVISSNDGNLAEKGSTKEIPGPGEVKSKLASGIYKAQQKTKRVRSVCWQAFLEIVDQNGQGIGYAQCTNCRILLRSGVGVGTKTLNSHVCTDASVAVGETIAISAHFQKVSKALSMDDKKTVSDALAYFCAKDLRPFEVVNGARFRRLVGVLLQFGSRGIHQDTVDDLLPDPKTRHVAAQVNLLKDKIKLEVRETLAQYGGGITTDFGRMIIKRFHTSP